ncbi:IclR family transcriptional regulator [Bordetella bronchiseptica]|uniref:IclR family transcriptional regulator n=1 Tax=Bordetella bronchiseptica TaxID=518 RepID=UPI00045B2806|nr:IclR family transcriptional regulator C-terminal domain-containing protein [Bordetella bronchiseptica]AOB25334.1 IclR family transcriptional regulator [Bordetella bronchiseptica]AZW42585.1 IclR family transcriptional regulator [Bordetella bronchiseptica]KCV64448.1 transcriptional regulator, IclR family, C-terminal domain protein [Bordetella bronchiseptica 99-R-0433]MBN3268004.1 IclR family transcriptional regulator [Bordetella bronchiseptica]
MASKKAAGEADKDHLFVNSVAKAFRLLEAFDKSRPTSGFSQAAREIGMEKSAAQRAAHTLWRLGYLDKVGRDGEYRLSRRCLDIGQRYLETNRLVVCTNPYLKFLRRKTNASVNLAMLDGTDTVFPVRYTSQEMLNNDLGERARIPAYCTATGIAIFSAMPDELVREVLERSDLKPLMPNSIWQMDRIMERVELARRDGYVLGVEEDFASDITIACPISDPATGDVAAIGVSYSSEVTAVEQVVQDWCPLVMSTAREVTARLAER